MNLGNLENLENLGNLGGVTTIKIFTSQVIESRNYRYLCSK